MFPLEQQKRHAGKPSTVSNYLIVGMVYLHAGKSPFAGLDESGPAVVQGSEKQQ
jgi:hypothetical protein